MAASPLSLVTIQTQRLKLLQTLLSSRAFNIRRCQRSWRALRVLTVLPSIRGTWPMDGPLRPTIAKRASIIPSLAKAMEMSSKAPISGRISYLSLSINLLMNLINFLGSLYPNLGIWMEIKLSCGSQWMKYLNLVFREELNSV